MVLLNSIERGLGMISIFILARILVPADFGVVGMAMSFVYFVQLFASFGFDVALINNQDATDEHFNSAWTLNVFLGLILTLIIVLAASPVANFYNKPEVFWVVCTMAALPLIGGFENIGVVAFRRNLNFRGEFVFQISRKLLGFLVTVSLAIYLRNYWALVAGTLAARIAGTVTSYLAHPFRPKLTLGKSRELIHFSRWLLANNAISFLNERLTDIVIGRSVGPAALGTYNVVFEFSHLPKTEIGAPINRALLPGFAKLQDAGAVRRIYLQATGMLAMIALPAAVGLSAIAPIFIPVALGPKWIAGVPVMEILALSGALLMFQNAIGSMLISRARPDLTMAVNLVYFFVFGPAIYYFVPKYGIIGAAWSSLGAATLMSPIYFLLVRTVLGVRLSELARETIRPVVGSVLMFFTVRELGSLIQPGSSFAGKAALLAAGILCGVLSYCAVIYVLWRVSGRPDSAERKLLEQVRLRIASFMG